MNSAEGPVFAVLLIVAILYVVFIAFSVADNDPLTPLYIPCGAVMIGMLYLMVEAALIRSHLAEILSQRARRVQQPAPDSSQRKSA